MSMFKKPFHFSLRRNLLEAFGFFLIYVTAGVLLLSFITAVSFLTALHGDSELHYQNLRFVLLTVALGYGLALSFIVIYYKNMDVSWLLIALLWSGVILLAAPRGTLYIPFYALFLMVALPSALTTWHHKKRRK